jgi:hypothetical protein
MATTTNYGWTTPNDTDLVKDGASAIRTLGQSIDTTFAELKGGTSGQMLTKASNTDLDLVWVTPEIGDITSITATSPLTGGGTSGAITVGIQDATTSVKGSVQLSDSTSTTSSVLAATPTAVKAAKDAADAAQSTANAAIPKSTVTTSGDVIYATGSSAVTRLGIGSAGQVLTVASGVPSWATPSAGAQGLTLISATSCSAVSSQAITAFSSTYDNYRIIISGSSTADNAVFMKLRSGSTDSSTGYYYYLNRWFSSNASQQVPVANGTSGFEVTQTFNGCWATVDLLQPFTTNRTGLGSTGSNFDTTATRSVSLFNAGMHNATTSYDGINCIWSAGAFTGTIFVYGYKKS